MAQVKFYRGVFEKYNADSTHKDAIYFSTNTNELFLNGVTYGLSKNDASKLDASVIGLSLENNVITVTYHNKTATTINLPLASTSADGLMSAADKVILDTLNGEATVEGSVKKQVADSLTSAKSYAEGLIADGSAIDIRIDALEAAIGESEEGNSFADRVAANEEAIAAINNETTGILAQAKTYAEGEADAAESAAKTHADGLKAALEGTLAEDDAKTLEALNDRIDTVAGDAKTYSIAKLTEAEVTALGNNNVKEAYKLVDEDSAQVGDIILIYKDSSLKNVVLEGQILNFTYILADGSESTVGVDVSAFLSEEEFGDGLQVIEHVVSVKKDGTSESFLSVSADGIKVAGIQNAIDKAEADAITAAGTNADSKIQTAIADLDAEITSADGSHVTVKVTEADGKITAVNVTESDIASAALLGTAADAATAETAFGKIAANAAAISTEKGRAEGVEAGLQSAIDTLNGDATTAGSVAKAVADSASALQASIDAKVALSDYDTKVAALEKADTDNLAAAKQDASDKDAALKGTIDAYTVNGKAISTNPTLDATNIQLGTYTSIADNSIDITATTTIADAIKALEDAWTWQEA